LIGFDRPAMAAVRDEPRISGNHGIRRSGCAMDRLVKKDFRDGLYLEFHDFRFRF
jgi:hypothetical protein